MNYQGYIFLCNNKTEEECFQRLLFGTNKHEYYSEYFSHIEVGDSIFLYNYETFILKGPFRAVTVCSEDIETAAWKDSYPYQVRVALGEEYNKPLTTDDIQHILKLSQTRLGLLPPPVITAEQFSKIIRAFQHKNEDLTPLEMRVSPKQPFAPAYIFKCNKETGGKCFSENIMGAPVQLFSSVVSRIQSGDMIFLWLLEEQKLYGVWRAKSRGQYDSTAFDSKYPAIVICERSMVLESGIDETQLRGIVPFNDPHPPYVIDYEKTQQIVEALLSANGASDVYKKPRNGDVGKHRTEDGHWVRSYSEVIIDNWLFYRGIVHAYDYRVQVGSQYLLCDFYLPQKKVFIEFYGLIGDLEYDKRRKQKCALYTQAGIRPVELYPRDIPVIAEVLLAKLSKLGFQII